MHLLFGKDAYSLSCQELNETVDTTLEDKYEASSKYVLRTNIGETAS